MCIGAQRAGTTWLSQILKSHTDIFVSEPKELQFFNAHYDKGIQWYETHFEPATEPARGELTPDYLHHKSALERISQHYPGIKIIVILRQPLDRTISAWQLYREARFQNLTLRDSCKKAPYLITQSLYSDRLTDLLALLPREQILIKLYDDLEDDPASFLTDIYKFLNVSPQHTMKEQDLTRKVNKVLLQSTQAKLERAGLGFIIDWVKNSPLDRPIRTILDKQLKQPDPRSLAEFHDVFLKDIESTEAATGLQLGAWKSTIRKRLA